MTISSPTPDVRPAMPIPRPGAPAVIVPTDGEEPAAGEITAWSHGAGGIVATARVDVGVEAAAALAGRKVWVRARAEHALTVIQAVAQPVGGRPGHLELTGVIGLAVEARRSAVRAQLRHAVLLQRAGVPSRGTWTIDLSSTGCRVPLNEDRLTVGERVRTAVTRADGSTLWLSGEVVRVDRDAGEAALHFVEISEDDRFALERDVLSWHSERVSVGQPTS